MAALSSRAGYHTTLEDVLPSNLRLAKAEMSEGYKESLHLASTVAEAVREADLVLDSLPDELESKLEIFSMVDRMAPPHTIMMTPTAVHSIADLASCTYRSERCFSFEVPDGILQEHARGNWMTVTCTKESPADLREAVVTFWSAMGWPSELRVDPALTPSPTLR
jgi:3-hydroxybutyryl-CoA dehydrogenase